MIFQHQGFASLSKTNISNCISSQCTGFDYVESTVNVSFCNFENLKATEWVITGFSCQGRIDQCNYINNSQEKNDGLVYVSINRLDIFNSSFQNNRQNNGVLFHTDWDGQIYIHQCSIDDLSTAGTVDTTDQGTESFKNNLTFIGLRPCEGNLEIVLLFVPKKENKICSSFKLINFLFGKFDISLVLLIK